MKNLAIIIPAFKEKYFAEALDSLVAQTVKDFSVYIGDDYSPNNLRSIVALYEDKLDIHYTRFPNNIGAKNLVNQWSRCIELSQNEKWLWLFSDDDIADSRAVENFYAILKIKENFFDVYRFNTCVIDKNGKVLSDTPVGPEVESSAAMAYNLLLGRRGNSMPDHIFSREIYDKCEGFVFTEFAQAADWATSILFSKNKGIAIIPNSKLYWRLSGTNISSVANLNKDSMIYGHIQFIQWVVEHFKYLENTQNAEITYSMIKKAARFNIYNIIVNHYRGLGNNAIFPLIKTMVTMLDIGYKNTFTDIYSIKRATKSRMNKPVNILKRLLNR